MVSSSANSASNSLTFGSFCSPASSKAAFAAFDEAGLQKLPKVKELDAEFAELLTKKKAAYPDYRKARNEMQELVRAQKNVERFFAEEKDTTEKTQTR